MNSPRNNTTHQHHRTTNKKETDNNHSKKTQHRHHHQQPTTDAQSQEQQQQHQPQLQQQLQRQHATPSNNDNHCSIKLHSRTHPLRHRCSRLRTEKTKEAARTVATKTTSHGTKGHGNSVAASGREQQNARAGNNSNNSMYSGSFHQWGNVDDNDTYSDHKFYSRSPQPVAQTSAQPELTVD